MQKIDVKAKFGTTIDSIWDNAEPLNATFDKIKERGYAVPKTVSKNSLLFVGINPSFKKGLKRTNEYYPEDNSHKYFAKFRTLSERTALPWSHVDLLFVRERQQSLVVEFWEDEKGREFLEQQLAVSVEIIENAQPKILVVNNTFARDLLRHESGMLKFIFDEDLGTEKIINNTALDNTPVFFTSMLTGQRALDNGSFDRLAWHINFVHNKIKQ